MFLNQKNFYFLFSIFHIFFLNIIINSYNDISEQNTIPQNNLPIYLQNYTVSILRNISSLDCTVTQGSNVAQGSKVPEYEIGTIEYSTLGVIPSNKKDARVWDFTPKKIHSDTLLCVLYDSFIGSITIRFKIKNF